MTTKKQVYDKYKGSRTCTNAARALLDALTLLDRSESMTIHTAKQCPRCSAFMREIRINPNFILFMQFCTECHLFYLYDRLGRIKSFCDDIPDNRPLLIPPKRNPLRPLERTIFNHLNSIRKDGKL